MKNTRNYERLLHVRKDASKYERDNAELILEKSKKTPDLYYREFFIVTMNSTDHYAQQVTAERFKDFRMIDDDAVENIGFSSVDFSLAESVDFENEINKITEPDFLKVVIFFVIIHDKFHKFSEDFQNTHRELKEHLIVKIKEFQNVKNEKKKRVSNITTSYQKFLVKELKITAHYVKVHTRSYEKLKNRVFKDQ
jgi:hypothetical protein